MIKPFMDKDFLLQTETAQELYHNHAAKMPIIDYHCHLRLSLPPYSADGCREQTFRIHRTDLAHGRPLQMARYAFERCGREVLHR